MEQNYQKIVNSLLKTLPDRGKEVLERRYGIISNEPETLEAIGEDFGVTRERVRQIEEAAFSQLRKNDIIKEVEDIFKYLYKHLSDHGDHRREERLLSDFAYQKSSPAMLFLLDLSSYFNRRNETKKHHTFWTVNTDKINNLENFVDVVEDYLKDTLKPLDNATFWKEVERLARKERLSLSKKALESWLDISKEIIQNRFNEWGLTDWPEIVPRSVGDKAYIVLQKETKPLHFVDIVERMNKVHFIPGENSAKNYQRSARPAHVQTVHNELIKDKRFVLVGRGIYALAQWGYEPGTVKEVLAKILKDAGSPLPINKIMAQVAKVRLVKPNTILLNLQNKHLFTRTSRGEYTV
ncbi:MAG: sigma factor-like helix-turn-helix DNA-binding protein, partial [bacterium]|nr:sigma factor-like helix-turn-helix DNA-binding protein [bacterium]